jgi:enoyl-CoA hydratase/carnithine racemase
MVKIMGYKSLKFSIDGKVAIITLNRPEKMNAWIDEMGEGLSRILSECNDNDDVRVVVITGAGKAFCAGADLARGGETFSGSDKKGSDEGGRAETVYPYMISKPVIAAINGHAIGVGITYPMTCDIRIVAEDAKIAFAFVRRGMIPELASHVTVARVAGLSCAADLLLSGRTISGSDAARMGLASKALPADEVLPEALRMARDIADNAAPVSVAISKQLLWRGIAMSVADMKRAEEPLFAWAGKQCDAREGINAFLEKRDPDWKLSPSKDFPREWIE